MKTREAIIINGTTDQPIMDVDPMDLYTVGDDEALFNDVMAAAFVTIIAIVSMNHTDVTPQLIWSDTQTPVTVRCDTCPRVVNVDTATLLDGQEKNEDDGVICSDCLA